MNPRSSFRWLLLVAAAGLLGCFVPREDAQNKGDRSCTRCHGDENRAGDALLKAAPPTDTRGNTDPTLPAVGAHARHLAATDTHAAVACESCHRVPKEPNDEGHNDGVTQLRFGPVAARDGGSTPAWNVMALRCTDTCHGATSGPWTTQRPESETCGTCHGLPPPAPHPQAGACEVCHAQVLSSARAFRDPSLHVDGLVEVSVAACGACHGQGDAGAPPLALDGGTAVSNRGVGAHSAHLQGGAFSKPVACETCHEVPDRPATARHPNGGAAEVKPDAGYDTTSTTCTNGCHRGQSPAWTTENANLGCASCHGAPPPVPHPQVAACALCHANAASDGGVIDRTLHVNGAVEVLLPTNCSTCHGSSNNAAPPRDLAGNMATTSPGVGAHQAHLVGRGMARVVDCGECHAVPATVTASGHLDGVTEVRFSGAAVANGAQPAYSPTTRTCANAACHAPLSTTMASAGGTNTTPVWTQVDGAQRTCTSCHGFPPPAPHPTMTACDYCHANYATDGGFVTPDRHINGFVDFLLP